MRSAVRVCPGPPICLVRLAFVAGQVFLLYPFSELCSCERMGRAHWPRYPCGCFGLGFDRDLRTFGIGAVAQLGEHLLCKQGVSGSIPLSSTKSFWFWCLTLSDLVFEEKIVCTSSMSFVPVLLHCEEKTCLEASRCWFGIERYEIDVRAQS